MRSILVAVRSAVLLLILATALEVVAPAQAAPTQAATQVATQAATADTAAPARRTCRVPRCYAAISVNPRNRAYGWAYNQPTRHRARYVAQRACRNHSPGAKKYCVRLVWVRGGCAAAAFRTRGGVLREYAGAYARTKRAAIHKARYRTRGPGVVHTWTWVCTAR